MTDTNTGTGKSPGIAQRETGGSAGNSRTVSQCHELLPGNGCNGPEENTELKWAQRHMPEEERHPIPRRVERKTELRNLSIGTSPKKKSAVRKETERDLSGRDPEVPYVHAERAIRALVCSLMERQDRMNEELFKTINDLGYRLDDVEMEIFETRQRRRT
ncbi:hypothetical protein [uncultured Methanoregula sp.]|uniref:hypothetical protein n=1 Tax=uncultured Methanoregula sp. TaxID=1005933 RepID=UPI002AAB68B0|nr:hypothetical protein [uncultured Methanoregula sp.]